MPVALGIGAAFCLILAWALPPFIGLSPQRVLALQLILTLTCLAIAGALLWYSSQKKTSAQDNRGTPADGSGKAQIESVLREADAKLASSTLRTRLSQMPVILVTGPDNTAKTTIVLHSGIDPELLAGQVNQEGAVIPTDIANAWLTRQAVLIEIGPAVQSDLRTWEALAHHIQAGKFGAAVRNSQAAPRAVVVCYECENLLKAGASETVEASAKNIRSQLSRLSASLGINLPVYVLFTKLDRVAFFSDYVRNFDNQETRQVLGATLAAEKTNSGVYGEREAARLTDELQKLAVSLSQKRTELLAREGDLEASLSAYEFPREFRKLRTAAVKFLLELCRPSQLSTGPFLRGFYFSGIRPVVVNEELAAEIERPYTAGAIPLANPDATSIFSYHPPRASASPQSQAARTTQRRVPEWVFLPLFFKDVVLGDRSGLLASASSTRANLPRRLFLAAALAISAFLLAATSISFLKNRELVDNVRQAAAGVSSDVPSPASSVSVESLTRLDRLRQALVRLTEYEYTHPPLSMRWGLYTGSELLSASRALYFARFKALLFGDLSAGLLKSMREWPSSPPPQADYGSAYKTLKGYLETTSNHDKATLQFLPPVLQERWTAEGNVDPEKVPLARRQFDFYTSELIRQNPYSSDVDEQTVAKARRYLAQFAGISRVYQAMLAEANQGVPAVNFNKHFPGSSAVVINNLEIPGAFTKPGFTFIANALKDPAKYVSGEKWVLGEQGSGAIDTRNLSQQIQALYYHDYINAWRDYLKKSVVVRYSGLADAARKLTLTSSPQSPLLALFWLASQNTDVNAPPVQQAFKPLHAIMPASSVDQYVGPSNSSYMTALTTLDSSIDQAAKLPPEQNQAAADQTGNAASAALLAVRTTALTLGLDADAHLEATIEKLMADPITHLDTVKPNGANPAPLNAAAADFCSKYRVVAAKFPFDPNSKTQASIDDLNAVFRPQQGTLWQFYDQKLNKILTKQGAIYLPQSGAKPEPTPRFVSFFNSASRFSNALYANGTSQDPKLTFALQPAFSSDIQSVTLNIDGQTSTLQANSPPQHFVWPGTGSGVRLVAKSGSDFTYPNYDGTWGLFEFFLDADQPLPSPEWMLKAGRSDKPVTSTLSNQPIVVHFNVDMLDGPPVFQKGYFRSLACVSEVAK
jgi:type VI secretion system protein ImpL